MLHRKLGNQLMPLPDQRPNVCRPLASGTYTVTATAPGSAPQTATVVVPATGAGVVHDFLLTASAKEVGALSAIPIPPATLIGG